MSQTKVKSGLLNFPDQTDFVKLPSGTTAQRPSSPEKGYSRYNTTDDKLEYWNGTIWQQLPGVVAPTIETVSYPGDDLAADPVGGQTITLTGTNFLAGASVEIGGTLAPVVTVVSKTEITFTAPAKTAGDYDILLSNGDNTTATFINGISYNGVPSWTTAAGNLGTFADGYTIPTITLVASEPDSGLISYSITTGGLPTGLTLAGANIDGTTPAVAGETTYNFSVTATDNENQSTERAFNIIVYKFVPSFNIVTWTGNGTQQNITGVGFSPDLVWVKARNINYDHQLHDSVRTPGYGLLSNSTALENFYNTITSFNSDGFTVNASSFAGTNASGKTFVGWCWRAGGAAVSNTDGTITSQVSANTESGFSVVTYTGVGSVTSTVGHGLNLTPEIIIVKGRDNSIVEGGSSWPVFHKDLINAEYTLTLETDSPQTLVQPRFSLPPNINTFTIGSSGFTNNVGSSFLAYCFHSVEGFSKVSSYTGTGTSINQINTGFAPRFVMIKRIDAAGGWRMYDNVRGTDKSIRANIPDAEFDDSTNYVDFYTNGFEFNNGVSYQSNPDINASGGTYIYMAFANQF